MRASPQGFLPPLLAVIVACAGGAGAAKADDKARYDLLEENDSLYFNTDKHYTQGLRLSYLAPGLGSDSAWQAPFALLGVHVPIFAPTATARRYAVFIGQSVFAPKNLTLKPPDPHDRPYAGWLYAGASLLQESAGSQLENLELDLGVVGPGALGKQVQEDWHQYIGISTARGWSSQLQNEPGAVLSYERFWRLSVPQLTAVDVVPMAGATVGNVFTYGALGAVLRIGTNLSADYGPARVRPGISGTDYFDGDRAEDRLGGYFYAGAQGRIVGRNIFLDGNSFRASPHVSKKSFVADFQTGVALFWSTRIRIDFSVAIRTEEFVGQRTPDPLGMASIAFSW